MDIKAMGKVKHNGKWYDAGSTISNVKKDEGERLVKMGAAVELEETEAERKARLQAEAGAKEKAEEEEKEALRAELESYGVSAHPNTGIEKLKEKLDEAKAAKQSKE
ncbi:hypothetical protein ABXS71_16845 [Bacillus infantis]|uniref:DUF7210 family protein n=1 Tax=Bacillus infantis TaxID=324767 RepID=UPI00344DF997